MEIEKSLELLVTAVTALSQNMDMRFDKMEERMDGLETRMERMETRMEKLETDVAGLKTDVAGLKTDVARLDARTERMEGDIAGLKTDVAKLRMSNEQHIVPALKAIGENWSDMYESVKVTREKVEQLEETQNLQGLILEGRIVRAK